MSLLKLPTKLYHHHHLCQPSTLSVLYHGRKVNKGAMLFTPQEMNVCLSASTPTFIYSPNWIGEKGVLFKYCPADIFFSSVKLNV